jgi:hypothetical protein
MRILYERLRQTVHINNGALRGQPEQRTAAGALTCKSRRRMRTILVGILALLPIGARAESETMLIDDFSKPTLVSALDTNWRGVSDQVMGGLSQASVNHETVDGRACLRLSGHVRLENGGGFIQAALDLSRSGGTLDASGYRGIRLTVQGNGEPYSVHLRTSDAVRPWQSYRAHFNTTTGWETIDLPFEKFAPYRLEASLNTTKLRRIGLVAIGRAFSADLTVAQISLYR